MRANRRACFEEDEKSDPESGAGKKTIAGVIAAGGTDVVIDFGAPDSGFALADSRTKKTHRVGRCPTPPLPRSGRDRAAGVCNAPNKNRKTHAPLRLFSAVAGRAVFCTGQGVGVSAGM